MYGPYDRWHHIDCFVKNQDELNYYDGGDMTAPFGGFKQSGNGRDKSIHALEKYTELKATWINLNP